MNSVSGSVLTNGIPTPSYYVGNWYEVTEGVATSYFYFGGHRFELQRSDGVTYQPGENLGITSVTRSNTEGVAKHHRYHAYDFDSVYRDIIFDGEDP